MIFIYNLAIQLYYLAIRIAAFYNIKARKWLSGRKNWKEDLSQWVNQLDGQSITWMHCASLGEFEQGRPVIEKIKATYPQEQILLTFFSPSGYEIRKNYSQADHVMYLPLDTPGNANWFLEQCQPKQILFIKYEFWVHFIQAAASRGIPIYLVSAIFSPRQIFFKPFLGHLFKNLLPLYRGIFVQDESSRNHLKNINIQQNVYVSGDTRVDRVIQIAAQASSIPIIEVFKGGHPILVLGSSWPEEERILAAFLQADVAPDWKIILAPHDISEKHIQQILDLFPEAIRFSKADKEARAKEILIIDNIGMLSQIYQYGNMAFIGGGFGSGLHNILEPMAFGLPVVFGPKYAKFKEAQMMVQSGGAFSIRHAEEFVKVFLELSNEDQLQTARKVILDYLDSNNGATDQVIQKISSS